MKKTDQQLLNNIIGQLQGIGRMMDDDKDCLAVVNQMKAAKTSFDRLINNYLSREVLKCLPACRKEDQQCQKVLAEFIKNK